MSSANVSALLNMYRNKGVHAVTTPSGVRFMGTRILTKDELRVLESLLPADLRAALKWQQA